MVRPKPPYPAIKGLFGKPTVVNNVTTLATIPPIVRHGGERYAAVGSGRSRGTIALQLAGALRTPGLVEVPFGISLREVLDTYGGGVPGGHRFLAVQAGGPLGDILTEEALDLPIEFEAFAAAGGMLGHGGIVVYDERTDPLALAHRLMSFCAEESCGKCAPCRVGSQRAAEILASWLSDGVRSSDMAALEDIAFAMRSASMCALGASASTPVMSALRLLSVAHTS
jgi:formate dehydrogenase iron-sulfur subunit